MLRRVENCPNPDEDGGGLGINAWVGIIAGVLTGLSILTIGSVYFSQRCCKPMRDNAESIFLKKRLQMEQKNLAMHKCKLPSMEHPSCTSILQQEDNDIAEEVKEMYSKINTDVSKPIVCCPDKKTLYSYNPKVPSSIASSGSETKIKYSQRKIMIEKVIQSINKNLVEQENLDTLSVKEIASEALKKIAKSHFDKRSVTSPRHSDYSYGSEALEFMASPEGRKFVETIESKRKAQEELEHDEFTERPKERRNESQVKKSSSRNLFTESEIHNADNMKTLFFEKWMKQAGESDENSDESVHKDISLSYDDVDSVLTSISRMDAKRMKKLKNTRFYKMISGIHSNRSDSAPIDDNQSDDEHSIIYEDDDHFNKRHNIDTITENEQNELFLTQEEINYMAVKDGIAKDDKENMRPLSHATPTTPDTQNKYDITDGKLKTLPSEDGGQGVKIKITNDERSETTLFKLARPPNLPDKMNVAKEAAKRGSSCSDVVSEPLSPEGDDGYIGETTKIPKSFGKYEVSYSTETETRRLTDWSQTRSAVDKTSLSHHFYDSDYTRTNKDDSCYSSGVNKGCCTSSSCTCSNKTTTWGEIAFKEREKYKNNDRRLFPELMEEVGQKEMSDVYYVVSNNNIFMLPVGDERSGCSESELTPTSYYLSDVNKRLSDIAGGRHTT